MKKWIIYLDPELKPLLSRFLEMRWQELSRNKNLLEKSDFDALIRAGHNMAGPAGIFGFDYLVEIGREMEEAAKHKDASGLRDIIARQEYFLANHEVRENA